jgi:hypothetical protein
VHQFADTEQESIKAVVAMELNSLEERGLHRDCVNAGQLMIDHPETISQAAFNRGAC